MKSKYLYIIIAVLVGVLVIRELFNSTFSTKQQLKLQSERAKNDWAAKQIQTSNTKEAELRTEITNLVELLNLSRKDIAGKESRLQSLKIKIKQYEVSDWNIMYSTDSAMERFWRARFPVQDSLYRISTATGLDKHNPR